MNTSSTQVIQIHGGDTYDTYEQYIADLKNTKLDLARILKKRWSTSLQDNLGDDFLVILPAMPNKQNAKYLEWKIWFDKLLPYVEDGVVLIGHSLGGIFLAKYLSENDFPKKIKATFLIAAPYDMDHSYSLVDFALPDDFSKFQTQANKLFIYHSEDDPVVTFNDFGKYKAKLPKAIDRIFKDKQHFNQSEFPELVEDIKAL